MGSSVYPRAARGWAAQGGADRACGKDRTWRQERTLTGRQARRRAAQARRTGSREA